MGPARKQTSHRAALHTIADTGLADRAMESTSPTAAERSTSSRKLQETPASSTGSSAQNRHWLHNVQRLAGGSTNSSGTHSVMLALSRVQASAIAARWGTPLTLTA